MENIDLEFIKKNLGIIEHDNTIINPKYCLCTSLEQDRYFKIINTFLESDNPEEKFEEYKDFILNPKFNTVIDILIERLSKKTEFHKFLKNNFQQIRNASNINNILRLYNDLKDVIPEEYEKHKFVIEEIHNQAYKKLYNLDENGEIAGKDFCSMAQLINITCAKIIIQDKTNEIEEFIKTASEGKSHEIIAMGSNSIVIKSGDKIIKINEKERDSDFNIIEHPRLLTPIIRKNISTDLEEPLYLELQEEVDTSNITEKDVLEVYKELREAGIKWCDPRIQNLGKQEGELVILDLDYIFREDDPRAKLVGNSSRLVRDYENSKIPRITAETAIQNALGKTSATKVQEANSVEQSEIKTENIKEGETKDD